MIRTFIHNTAPGFITQPHNHIIHVASFHLMSILGLLNLQLCVPTLNILVTFYIIWSTPKLIQVFYFWLIDIQVQIFQSIKLTPNKF